MNLIIALDYPICSGSFVKESNDKSTHIYSQRSRLLKQIKKARSLQFPHNLQGSQNELLDNNNDQYEPCEDNWLSNYLNLNEVKQAIHVKNDISWQECSDIVNYKESDSLTSMVPHYDYLIKNSNISMLVYSGDDDSICSTLGTQKWIWTLDENPSKWNAYIFEGQIVGYHVNWPSSRLAFVTIHGAGHEVPTYSPEVALDLWNKYLSGAWTST